MVTRLGRPLSARTVVLALFMVALLALSGRALAGFALVNAGALSLNRALAAGDAPLSAATTLEHASALVVLPAGEETLYLLGLARQASGDPGRAARAWQGAPPVATTLLAWGDKSWRSGAWAEAAAWYGQAARVVPEGAYAHYRVGQAALKLGHWDEAGPALARAAAAAPDPRVGPSDILLQQAILAVEAGAAPDWPTALALLDEAVTRDDFRESAFNPVQAQYVRGEALRGLGRLDEAIAPYERVIAGWPEHYWAHYWLGSLLWEARGDVGGAETLLATALEIDPDQAAAYLELARLYAATGRADEAQALLAEAAGRFPEHPGVTALREDLLRSEKEPTLAP